MSFIYFQVGIIGVSTLLMKFYSKNKEECIVAGLTIKEAFKRLCRRSKPRCLVSKKERPARLTRAILRHRWPSGVSTDTLESVVNFNGAVIDKTKELGELQESVKDLSNEFTMNFLDVYRYLLGKEPEVGHSCHLQIELRSPYGYNCKRVYRSGDEIVFPLQYKTKLGIQMIGSRMFIVDKLEEEAEVDDSSESEYEPEEQDGEEIEEEEYEDEENEGEEEEEEERDSADDEDEDDLLDWDEPKFLGIPKGSDGTSLLSDVFNLCREITESCAKITTNTLHQDRGLSAIRDSILSSLDSIENSVSDHNDRDLVRSHSRSIRYVLGPSSSRPDCIALNPLVGPLDMDESLVDARCSDITSKCMPWIWKKNSASLKRIMPFILHEVKPKDLNNIQSIFIEVLYSDLSVDNVVMF